MNIGYGIWLRKGNMTAQRQVWPLKSNMAAPGQAEVVQTEVIQTEVIQNEETSK